MLYDSQSPEYNLEKTFRELRKEYSLHELDEKSVLSDPVKMFEFWFKEATEAKIPDTNAMFLATATPEGIPSGRIILLKGVSDGYFMFFTNYNSRKGNELNVNPAASLTFYWHEMERQVRIEGTTELLSESESYKYFSIRPRDSRIGAWASPQSQPIKDRSHLEQLFSEAEQKYMNEDNIPLPPHWGGYRLRPHYFEFWQGRQNRLHDRITYVHEPGSGWKIGRIAP